MARIWKDALRPLVVHIHTHVHKPIQSMCIGPKYMSDSMQKKKKLMSFLFSLLLKGPYSVKKATAVLGIGTDNVVEEKRDERYVS